MAIQSEAALETGLVQTLQQMSYEYIQIDEGTNLKENFKRQLEIHNKKQAQFPIRIRKAGVSCMPAFLGERISCKWVKS